MVFGSFQKGHHSQRQALIIYDAYKNNNSLFYVERSVLHLESTPPRGPGFKYYTSVFSEQ